ncbi:hypothetical protein [Ralstonia solanacearum]|nr:hypothetical protein [Ralstonia solanacearum]MCG3577485.1 hypothetical protein [Ralstonia solanacearum]MCL9826469.1 hypothetical protein [Ralstonia solanacearum]MCL9831287.1 hypothetical protein [Ralstonia solanacearum]MCL9836068.1 hypothetical protein [Ralstonia solanacearum]MCL9842579.1 hypothetical protein [Ralstonia solanacearum]
MSYMATDKRAGLIALVCALVFTAAMLVLSKPWIVGVDLMTSLIEILYLPLWECETPGDDWCFTPIGEFLNPRPGTFGIPTRYLLLAAFVILGYGLLLVTGATRLPGLHRKEKS